MCYLVNLVNWLFDEICKIIYNIKMLLIGKNDIYQNNIYINKYNLRKFYMKCINFSYIQKKYIFIYLIIFLGIFYELGFILGIWEIVVNKVFLFLQVNKYY